MNTTRKIFLLGMVMTAFFFFSSIKGDGLFSICLVEDEEPWLDWQLMAFTDPEVGVCDWPRFAGGLDESTINWLEEPFGLAGIHVDHTTGLLHGAAIHEYFDPVYEGRRRSDDGGVVEEGESKKRGSDFEGQYLGDFGSWNGGMTVLRKWTDYSPNGRVDFSGSHIDAIYSTIPGPGLTGDCSSRKYFSF